MQFVITFRQVEGTQRLRELFREQHVAFRKELAARSIVSGPLLATDSDVSTGSLVILEASGPDEAAAIAAKDPYCREGVLRVESVQRMRVMAFRAPRADASSWT